MDLNEKEKRQGGYLCSYGAKVSWEIEKQASLLRHGGMPMESDQHLGETGLASPALQSRGRWKVESSSYTWRVQGVVQTGIYRERHTNIIKGRGPGIMKGLSQGLLDYRSCRGSQGLGKFQRRPYSYLVLLSSAQNKTLPFGSHHQSKKYNQTKTLGQGDYFPKEGHLQKQCLLTL